MTKVYIIILIDNLFIYLENDLESKFVFNALIQNHRGFCSKENCPSRDQNLKLKKYLNINKDLDENYLRIILMIDSIYQFSIDKLH